MLQILGCLPHWETAKFHLEVSFLSLRCYFQVDATYISWDNCSCVSWPSWGNDAFITYGMSSQILFAWYLKIPSSVIGCKSARIQGCTSFQAEAASCKNMTLCYRERKLRLVSTEWAVWPALLCTCSRGSTCADFMIRQVESAFMQIL